MEANKDQLKQCDHPESEGEDISKHIKDYLNLKPHEKVFYCKKCSSYCFTHPSGIGEWVAYSALIDEVIRMRSFEVFYDRELDPNKNMTPEARASKGNILQALPTHYQSDEFLKPEED